MSDASANMTPKTPTSVRRMPADAGISHSNPWRLLVVAAGVICACLWSYWPILVDLWAEWQRNADQSAGMIVPIACLYLIYCERHRLAGVPRRPALWSGLLLLGVAQLVRFFGVYAIYGFFQRISLVLSVLAIVLAFGGPRLLRNLAYPLILLFLMVPLPGRLYAESTLPLQTLAAKCSTALLVTLGVPAARNGNVIDLMNGQQIAVAEACNGLSMVTAFVIVAAVFAYVATPSVMGRLIILASSAPLAMVANVLRIVATALLYNATDSEFAERFFHDFVGLAMMPLAVAMVWLECRLIIPLLGPSGRASVPKTLPFRAPSRQSRQVGAAILAIAGVLVLTGAGHRVLLAHRDDLLDRYLPPALPWSDFPHALYGYVSEDVPLGSDVLRVAGVDAYVNRVYRSPQSPAPVSLYIGYWGTANAGLGHGPEVCLPVHGWRAVGDPAREQMTLSTSLDRRLQTLSYRTDRFVREDLGEQQELVSASFHIVNDEPTLTPISAFVHGPGNPFHPKLHYSLQFQIITPIVREDATQAIARLTGFLREAIPPLARHLPKRSVELTPRVKGGKPK